MLFLTDVDHVGFEKANETRQNNLQSATVSLQVVIGLCRRKETAALKIKAAVSNGRVKLSALRRLFFFAVVRQMFYTMSISKISHYPLLLFCFVLCKSRITKTEIAILHRIYVQLKYDRFIKFCAD